MILKAGPGHSEQPDFNAPTEANCRGETKPMGICSEMSDHAGWPGDRPWKLDRAPDEAKLKADRDEPDAPTEAKLAESLVSTEFMALGVDASNEAGRDEADAPTEANRRDETNCHVDRNGHPAP